MKEKTRCSKTWTEAQYISFIKSQLRGGTSRWKPKQECIRDAKVSRGMYKCEGCAEVGPYTLPPLEGRKRRRKNIVADHIKPVVDPKKGFTTWDDFISRLYCERDGFQALCWNCHENKSKEEREIAVKRRAKNG